MKKLVTCLIVFALFFASAPLISNAAGRIDAPFIKQMPELPRGCEVTSLAMMLQHAGVNVSKMTLAKEVKKVPFYKNGLHGNPYDGFVGEISTFSKPGLGVYHGPIASLAEKYLPGQITDLTGKDIREIYKMIDLGRPVWVITNTKYKHLPSSSFHTWNTSSGKIKITYSEHSVLVTGYDSKYVYINDPLYHRKNRAVSRSGFEAAWKQMGRQAISYFAQEDKFFADTKTHWAKPSIEFVSQNGYMKGYSDYWFGPNDKLTRGQAVAVLDRFLPATYKVASKTLDFSDIQGHFAKDSILRIASAGYLGGYKDGTFKPHDEITRAQLAIVLSRILNDEGTMTEKAFHDVPTDHWAYSGIQEMQSTRIILGSSDGYFRPNDTVTRGELAVIINRLHGKVQ
jgi:uncharacterized protein YvpB